MIKHEVCFRILPCFLFRKQKQQVLLVASFSYNREKIVACLFVLVAELMSLPTYYAVICA